MRTRDASLTAVFLAALAVPLLLTPFVDGFSALEQRAAKPFPRVAPSLALLTAFPRDFEAWQKDHFPGRSQLVRWQSALKLRCGISSSDNVVLGLEEFLHYRPELEAHRPGSEFSPAELEAWRQRLEKVQAQLAAQGTRMLFLAAPDKSSIYPETLTGVRWLGRVSRLDQLLAYLKERSSVPALDLRPRLRALKPGGLVYMRTDTHWNMRAAWAAADAIAEVTGQRLPAFEISWATGPGGDLAGMLSLPDLLPETRPTLNPVGAPAPSAATAFLLHDSFGNYLKEPLRLLFAEVRSENTRTATPGALEAMKPTWFIFELVEREVRGLPPGP